MGARRDLGVLGFVGWSRDIWTAVSWVGRNGGDREQVGRLGHPVDRVPWRAERVGLNRGRHAWVP